MTSAADRPPYSTRRAGLRAKLDDLDAVLITDLINIRYLTGFTGSNAALLVGAGDSDEGTVFCTDGRYITQSEAEVPDLQRVIDRTSDLALLTTAGGRIGIEAAHLSVLRLEQLKAAVSAELTITSELVEELRAVKDEGEIEALRRACAVGDQALGELIAAGGIRPGRTEREVGLDLDQRMRVLGAGGPAFETIVAAGAHSAIPHHRPTSAVLATGDFVKIDFGAEVAGYHSDMTRTFVLGAPADWQREVYELVATSQRAGRDAATVGRSGREVDAAARDIIRDAGYGDAFSHGLGHGIGLEVHEAPNLSTLSTAIISADMCVTVEPGVYLPGRGGVRIEDSGVVRGSGSTDPGYEVFTLTSRDLVEL